MLNLSNELKKAISEYQSHRPMASSLMVCMSVNFTEPDKIQLNESEKYNRDNHIHNDDHDDDDDDDEQAGGAGEGGELSSGLPDQLPSELHCYRHHHHPHQ